MIITLKKNGIRKQIKVGVSWTTLFFGIWVPLLRGMWPQFAIFLLTLGFAGFYYFFKINAIYAEKLVADGWEISKEDIALAAAAWGILP